MIMITNYFRRPISNVKRVVWNWIKFFYFDLGELSLACHLEVSGRGYCKFLMLEKARNSSTFQQICKTLGSWNYFKTRKTGIPSHQSLHAIIIFQYLIKSWIIFLTLYTYPESTLPITMPFVYHWCSYDANKQGQGWHCQCYDDVITCCRDMKTLSKRVTKIARFPSAKKYRVSNAAFSWSLLIAPQRCHMSQSNLV